MALITDTIIINSLTLGAVYTIVALGLVFVYKSTGVINFAHGFLAMAGAYFYFYVAGLGLGVPASLAVTVFFALVAGYLIQRAFMRPLLGKGILPPVMMTIMLGFALEAMVRLIWGGGTQPFPRFLPTGTLLGLPTVKVTIVVASALLTAGLFLFFRWSDLGIRLRALADDQEQITAIQGDINRLLQISWMLGVLLAVAGGLLYVHIVPLSPAVLAIGIVVFPVVILGGLESMGGAIIGGFTIALAQAFFTFHLSEAIIGINQLVPQVIALLVLLLLPYGLFGEEIIERL